MNNDGKLDLVVSSDVSGTYSDSAFVTVMRGVASAGRPAPKP